MKNAIKDWFWYSMFLAMLILFIISFAVAIYFVGYALFTRWQEIVVLSLSLGFLTLLIKKLIALWKE